MISDALRQGGASVHSLHREGGGCPDLLVGFRGVTLVAEVKTDDGKMNDLQSDWHAKWKGGPVAILRTLDDVVCLLLRISTR